MKKTIVKLAWVGLMAGIFISAQAASEIAMTKCTKDSSATSDNSGCGNKCKPSSCSNCDTSGDCNCSSQQSKSCMKKPRKGAAKKAVEGN